MKIFVRSLLLVLLATSSWGCGSVLLCGAVEELAVRDMVHRPIYERHQGACREVPNPDRRGSGDVFADPACTRPVPFAGTSFSRFCKQNLLEDDATKNAIGNPAAWTDLDAATGATPWTLSQGTRLHLAAVDQTRGRDRPFLRRFEYREVDGCRLGIHVYTADLDAHDLKPLLYLHGGGWQRRGSLAIVGAETTAPLFTAKGYLVVAPFLRLTGDVDGPADCRRATGREVIEDVEAAMAWVFEHGVELGMDPRYASERRLSVVGHSSGGHLAAYLAVHHPENVERALLVYPATDFEFAIAELRPGGLYDGQFADSVENLLAFLAQPGATTPADVDLGDPFVLANSFPQILEPDPSGFPPMVIVHGDADDLVPVELSLRQCQGLDPAEPLGTGLYGGGDLDRACGPASELHVVAGAGHVLDLRCFTGDVPSAIVRLLGQENLCPSGSADGERRVREVLEAAIRDDF